MSGKDFDSPVTYDVDREKEGSLTDTNLTISLGESHQLTCSDQSHLESCAALYLAVSLMVIIILVGTTGIYFFQIH